jgi:DNA ligase D-like protein (predicted 3'-phosphoesterase)
MKYKNISGDRKKILILSGPKSSGKTSLIVELSNMNYYVVNDAFVKVAEEWKLKKKILPWNKSRDKKLYKQFLSEVLTEQISLLEKIPKRQNLIILDCSMEDILAKLYCYTGDKKLDRWEPTSDILDTEKQNISVLILKPIEKTKPTNDDIYPTIENQWREYYALTKQYKKSKYNMYEELTQMDIEERMKYIDEILVELLTNEKSVKKTTEQIIGKTYINILKEETETYPHNSKFVIHDHYASHHHFDLRIKKGNKLSSWALPKAHVPEKDGEKILAVRTPDHDLYWMTFKGEIPKGEYGAGTVDIYDTGKCVIYKWSSNIVVKFEGKKTKGYYSLIKTKGDNYLFLRMNQEEAKEKYK